MTIFEKVTETISISVEKLLNFYCPSYFDYQNDCDEDGSGSPEVCQKCWNKEYKEYLK